METNIVLLILLIKAVFIVYYIEPEFTLLNTVSSNV